MKLEKISIDGKKDTIEVLDKLFSAKINSKLVSSVLYKTNANYKGRHAKTTVSYTHLTLPTICSV